MWKIEKDFLFFIKPWRIDKICKILCCKPVSAKGYGPRNSRKSTDFMLCVYPATQNTSKVQINLLKVKNEDLIKVNNKNFIDKSNSLMWFL